MLMDACGIQFVLLIYVLLQLDSNWLREDWEKTERKPIENEKCGQNLDLNNNLNNIYLSSWQPWGYTYKVYIKKDNIVIIAQSLVLQDRVSKLQNIIANIKIEIPFLVVPFIAQSSVPGRKGDPGHTSSHVSDLSFITGVVSPMIDMQHNLPFFFCTILHPELLFDSFLEIRSGPLPAFICP